MNGHISTLEGRIDGLRVSVSSRSDELRDRIVALEAHLERDER